MTPFRHPAEPHSIDQVMDAIRTQLVEGGPASAAASPPPADEPPGAAPAPPAPVSPVVITAAENSRLLAQLEILRQRQNLDPGYRIYSHRPVIGRAFDLIKRVIHWGSRPYAEAIRAKQEAFNDTALQALREISAQLEQVRAERDVLEQQLHEAVETLRAEHDRSEQAAQQALQAGLTKLEQTTQTALDPLQAWQAWHGRDFDLDTFFSSIPKEQRLAAMDVTRGPYDDIRYRQSRYAPLFKGLPGQVLDIGCGRGEFVNMMRYEGIETWGCDTDPAMIEIATREGATAVVMDGLSALRSVPDHSLGGVFAAQVVEHLFPGVLLELLRLVRQKLAPGGRVVLETLNPATLGVLAKSYYRDLDHKQPIHPQYLKLLMELAGFVEVQLVETAPFGDEDRLADLPPAETLGLAPAARDALQARLDQLNHLLYGPQDYYIDARQPATPLASPSGA